MADPQPDSGLLRELRTGAAGANTLVPLVYNELRRLAHSYLRQERAGHTLQATALVHEVYLRLIPQEQASGRDRAQFVAVAANLMRQILVDYARTRQRDKRGGKDQQRVPFDEGLAVVDPADFERWVALDDALRRLAELDERQSRVVELRYFGGLSVEETADILSVSSRTVKRDWSLARAWIRRELNDLPATDSQ